MKIPVAAPTDVLLQATHDGGGIIGLRIKHAWWKFWIPGSVGVQVTRQELIWLNQTTHKMMKETAIGGELPTLNELLDDVMRALVQCEQERSGNVLTDVGSTAARQVAAMYVANMLIEKGYYKA